MGESTPKAAKLAFRDVQIGQTFSLPGLTRTELTEHYHEHVFKMEATRIPLGRLADPDDVANTVVFLLGDESAFLTGVNVPVSGGQVMP
jgi:3-oxoacyl-[acyl-carrier protein] reductase